MNSSNALLYDALHVSEHIRVFLDNRVREVAAVVEYHVRLPAGLGVDAAVDAPPEVVFFFAFPCKYGIS